MKKVILLAFIALMMTGCSGELRRQYSIYAGSKWDVLKINDSIYFAIPKYEKYSTPHVLNIKENSSLTKRK